MTAFFKQLTKPFICVTRIYPIVYRSNFCTDASKTQDTWTEPIGHNTGIRIFNTATKSLCPLILPNQDVIKWYVCGPTVYDEPHIGHASCYVRLDILRRILTHVFNINVVYVMNMTDVDDKIIIKARQTNQDIAQVSQHYEQKFSQSMQRLHVMPPTITCRVTEYLSHIESFIQKLVSNGSAYVTSKGSVYFSCNSYPSYGFLSNHKEEPSASSEIDNEKRDPRDFALWKSSKPGEPFWSSPWGEGRPGWHIECSAMASHIFGDTIDIHSGGKDLLFPHHENEVAQSHCYHNTKQWVNYWLHTGVLHLKNDLSKMSKSLRNVVTIDELLKKYTSNQFRIYCLLSHYRNDLEYDDEAMSKAVRISKKLFALQSMAHNFIQNSITGSINVDEALLLHSLIMTQKNVKAALADDFNTALAMRHIMNLVHTTNIELCKKSSNVPGKTSCSVAAVVNYIETMMSGLGVSLNPTSVKSKDVSDNQLLEQVIKSTIAFRSNVRNFALGGNTALATAEDKTRIKEHRKANLPLVKYCDQIRDELSTLANVKLMDTKDGKTMWEITEGTKETSTSD